MTTSIAPLGTWYSQLVVAAIASAALASRKTTRRPAAGAAVICGAALLSAVAGFTFDRVLPQPPAPPGQSQKRKSVFPSGHTMSPLAIALTSAWVAHREGIVDGRIGVPIALAAPALTVSGKLMERKHWLSDVVGGYAAGLAIAATVLALYDRSANG